jgi:hypothetical protein
MGGIHVLCEHALALLAHHSRGVADLLSHTQQTRTWFIKAHSFLRVSPDEYKVSESSLMSTGEASIGMSDSMFGPSSENA